MLHSGSLASLCSRVGAKKQFCDKTVTFLFEGIKDNHIVKDKKLRDLKKNELKNHDAMQSTPCNPDARQLGLPGEEEGPETHETQCWLRITWYSLQVCGSGE